MTRRQKKISWIVGIIATLVTIASTCTTTIKSLFQSEDKTAKTNIITRGNENKIISGNGNNIQENNIVINNNSSVSEKKNSKIEYSILGTSNEKLLQNLKKSKKIDIIPKSNNVIEITHNGEVSSLNKDSNSFIYGGGKVVIKVNNLICFKFEDLKIEEMKQSSEDEINNEIQKNIDNYINNNPKLFLNKIIECTSNY